MRGDLMSTRNLLVCILMAFLVVAGIGAATSYLQAAREAAGLRDPRSHSGSNGEMLARLTDYTRSFGTEDPLSPTATGKPLPDVNTMIDRLAARLETAPGDIAGWRMLGWSYFHTGRYAEAASAYARAVALDPNSEELKSSYAEARVKASATTLSPQREAIGNGSDVLGAAKDTPSEEAPPRQHEAAIRSMVDGLAHRLESSPRDLDGWTRLMRSRVVLGEREVAAAAFHRALEIFKEDPAATSKITAAGIELGLKTR
jgi:cytochrome c-type biogenesis protein CcmH